MLENLSKLALRLMAATLFLIFFNTLGMPYGIELPINLFHIIILSAFGIPGLIGLVLLGFMI